MSRQRWLFQTVDSWFFREARAHDAVGVGQLESQFPPPVTTLMGAIRTHLGDLAGVDWRRFATDRAAQADFAWLGNGQQLGELRVTGPHLYQGDERLYPVPADLLIGEDAQGKKVLSRLRVGEPVRCDLGRVALPALDGAPAGSKPVEGAWLTANGLARWQAGECPEAKDLVWRHEHLDSEPRLGIGRDTQRATVQDGQLYQTRHLRFRPDSSLRIGLELDGVPEDLAARLPDDTSVRLGGEGREAQVEIQAVKAPSMGDGPTLQAGDRGVALMLETPGAFRHDDQAEWCLPGFTPVCDDQGITTHWQGRINGVELRLVSAAMGRAQRLGGWDQQQRRPRAVRSLVAPGSVYCCEPVEAEPAALAAALQSVVLGEEQAWGFGRFCLGRWR
ncbi:CRISPR-associated protein [Halomonas sp. THAF5a]|uniref:type III-B CRISPR module-associated Cmr3 family protein n=1 Tax=Halomonas sp. THAF5a TaxID=2587844 RepID=UPI0012684A12|nr:type III-B CRISPR module-associated Cmr3 family protein [Halomonas sp. THAF5a]QFU02561.1 CRISPR-associated protein [Halomonas sp. THAF5a]